MQHILSHENFLRYLYDLILAIFIEDNNIVDIRTVANVFVFLQAGSHKTFLAIDVEFFIRLNYSSGLNSVEIAYLGHTRVVFAILVLQELEPVGSYLHHIGQVMVYILNLSLYARHEFVSLVFVELQYSLHLYFKKPQYVVFGHFAHKLRVVWCKSLIYMFAYSIHIRSLLKFLVLIDTLLNEYFLQRGEMELFEQFRLSYLKFFS